MLYIMPVWHGFTQLSGHHIVNIIVAVDHQFKRIGVSQMLQYWIEEIHHCVAVQIGRDKSDSQLPVWITLVAMLCPTATPRCFELLRKCLMGAKLALCIKIRVVALDEQLAAVDFCEVGIDFQYLLASNECFLQ